MKIFRLFMFMTVVASWMSAVEIGDTYDKVIAEKGEPQAKLAAGQTMILNYADQRIKLKAGKVVELDSKLPEAAVAQDTAPANKPPSAVATGGWTTNYPAALAQAKATNTNVFLFFTGSDWCGWCVRLDREVLSTPEFKSYANKNLILVKLDFPRGEPQSASVKAQNEQLAHKYQVSGFPTVIILDSKGKQIGRTGYQKGGPEAFIETLKKY
jgi:thiol:disulfide interchange protein